MNQPTFPVQIRLILLLAALACTCPYGPALNLRAQVTDSLDHAAPVNRFNNEEFNRRNIEGTLQSGGAFYLSNPAPVYEVDSKLAYLWEGFDPLEVVLRTGDTVRVNGRLRLPDHRFEIMRPDGVYELDQNKIARVIRVADRRQFVQYFDMAEKRSGLFVYEELFAGGGKRLWVLREANFVEDKPHSMFDTSETTTKLKRSESIFLMEGEWGTKAETVKQLLAALGSDKGSPTGRFARSERLKNKPEDLARLLEYHVKGGMP